MGRHVEAAVVHDYLYMTAMWMRDIADAVFLAAMKAAEVPAWRRVMPPPRPRELYIFRATPRAFPRRSAITRELAADSRKDEPMISRGCGAAGKN